MTDWIDRDGYLLKKSAEIDTLKKIDPDAYDEAYRLLMEEYESSADIDNPPERIVIRNQKCENCGHHSDYDNHCWNCKITIIAGRSNWIPDNNEEYTIEEQNCKED